MPFKTTPGLEIDFYAVCSDDGKSQGHPLQEVAGTTSTGHISRSRRGKN